MNALPAMLSAVAATAAATLAAVNLYVSGHREDVRWSRAALIDALTSFLDQSFQAKDAVKAAVRLILAGAVGEGIGELHRAAVEAEQEMRTLQTRLRVLAPPRVVDAAQVLRTAVKRYIATLDHPEQLSTANDKSLRVELWRHRRTFVAETKRALSL